MESTCMYFPGKIGHFLENGKMVESEWSIIIFSKYFKIQFAWPTFQNSVIINVIKINWNQSLIVLPKYVGLIDCIDKSKNTKFTGLNTFMWVICWCYL
jgi:hypothetical protein